MDRTARMQERNSRGTALARGLGLAAVLVLLGTAVLIVLVGSDANDRSASSAAVAAVARASDRLDRATDAVASHETDTGVADPAAEAAEARNRLDALQDARDRAVAAGDPAASVLQRQVATAQQEAFDLDAVARRRVELVDARRDAAAALERFSRRGTSDEIGAESGSLPLWRIVLAGLLFAGALAVAALVVVRSRRPPRRAARSRTPRSSSTLPATNPQPRLEPQPEAELEADPVARLSLDEIEQRLAALEHD